MKVKTEKAQGSAKIVIDLTGGVITVTHGQDGSELFKSEAKEGDWDKIWEAIENVG